MNLFQLFFLLMVYVAFIVHDSGQRIKKSFRKADSIMLIADSMHVAYELNAIKNHEKLDEFNCHHNELYKTSEQLIGIIDTVKITMIDYMNHLKGNGEDIKDLDTLYCHRYSQTFKEWKRMVKETDRSYYVDSLPLFTYSCEFQRSKDEPLVYKMAMLSLDRKGIIQVCNKLTKK